VTTDAAIANARDPLHRALQILRVADRAREEKNGGMMSFERRARRASEQP
jgi:hypothetical protein